MQTLRKGRETLVTMLEAFIYDPLVDWTGLLFDWFGNWFWTCNIWF